MIGKYKENVCLDKIIAEKHEIDARLGSKYLKNAIFLSCTLY